MRVLYVDDNDWMLALVRELLVAELVADLGEEEWDVIAVSSIDEAHRELRARPFDAVISDFHLETRQTGADLLKEVAAVSPATRRILVSGCGDALRNIAPCVADAVFVKPFDIEELRTSILRPRRESDRTATS